VPVLISDVEQNQKKPSSCKCNRRWSEPVRNCTAS